MKNIEFYYDDLIRCRTFKDAHNLAIDKGLIPCECIEEIQELLIWLNEEHQILDKQEKEYLRNIIRPFASIVNSIKKRSTCRDEYIVINYLEDGNYNEICLPNLRDKTMYKGMKPNERYTLEELGL